MNDPDLTDRPRHFASLARRAQATGIALFIAAPAHYLVFRNLRSAAFILGAACLLFATACSLALTADRARRRIFEDEIARLRDRRNRT